jgi:hypothetical protein
MSGASGGMVGKSRGPLAGGNLLAYNEMRLQAGAVGSSAREKLAGARNTGRRSLIIE